MIMSKELQERIAKEIFWKPFSVEYTSSEMINAFKDAYPSCDWSETRSPVAGFFHVLFKHNPKFAAEFIDVLVATNPMDETNQGCAYVAPALTELSKAVVEGLREKRIGLEHYKSLYERIGNLKFYSDFNITHPFLHGNHGRELLIHKVYDCFEFVRNEFDRLGKQKFELLPHIKGMFNPFFDGEYSLQAKILEDVVEMYATVGKYSLMPAHQQFWRAREFFVRRLKDDPNPQAIRTAIDMCTKVFTIEKSDGVKASVKDGTAWDIIHGTASVYVEAKKAGFNITNEDIANLLKPIEKIGKSIGENWAKSLDQNLKDKYTVIFDGIDKDELFKKKLNKNLIRCLEEILPDHNWMKHAKNQDKYTILMDDFSL